MFLAITAFSQPIEGVNTIYEVMTDWDRLVDVSIQGDYAYFADWEWGIWSHGVWWNAGGATSVQS